MISRPTHNNHFLITAWLLLVGLGLVGLSVYFCRIYSLPIVGTYQYAVHAPSSTVIWYQDNRVEPTFVDQLDLHTGRVFRARWQDIQAKQRQPNSRGRRFVWGKPLEIYDEETNQLLWRGKIPFDFPCGINHQYVIEPGKGEFKYVDLDQVLETGLVEVKSWPVAGVVLVKPTETVYAVHPLPGTNRFIYHMQDKTNSNMAVFEIEAGQLRQIAVWPTTPDSAVILYNDKVMTAAPSMPEVEVRSLGDFQSVKTLPLPKGLATWGDVSLSNLLIRNDLFSFVEAKTGITRVYRLDDFTLVPELDLPVMYEGMQSEEADDRRYVVLSDARLRALRTVVYDTMARRVAVDCLAPIGVIDKRVAAGHLVFVNEKMGMTVDMIDLNTGKLARRFQPFMWVAWTMPLTLLVALGWLMAWLRVTVEWKGWAVVNILLISGLFVVPPLAHVALYGSARVLFRPAMGYPCVVALALSFCLSLYVVYGRQRVLLRSAPVWLMLAAVLALANLYGADNGRRGLDGKWGMVGAAISLFVVFSFVSVAMLGCMRMMGFGLSLPADRHADGSSRTTIPLRDIFVLTACIAAFVAAAAPNWVYLTIPVQLLGTMIGSLLVCAPALLGLIALAPSTAIYRFMRTVAVLLSLLLIVEISLHVSLGHLHMQPWYYLFVFVRYFTFLFLVTFTFGAILRSAGYRWCKTRSQMKKSETTELHRTQSCVVAD